MINLSEVEPILDLSEPSSWRQISSTGEDVPLFPPTSIPSRLDPPEQPVTIPECFK